MKLRGWCGFGGLGEASVVVVLLVVAPTDDIVVRHATKGRCLMIFIVFGSPHLSRRGYNNNEYYYYRRKSAAAMAYLAVAAPTPLLSQIEV